MKHIDYCRRGNWMVALMIIGLAAGIFFLYYCVVNTFPNSEAISYICGSVGFIAWVSLGSKWDKQIKASYKQKQEEHDKKYEQYLKEQRKLREGL